MLKEEIRTGLCGYCRCEIHTDMTIKTKYVFVDGKSIELAFDEDNLAAAYILEDRRREESLARKVRRHNYSLDAIKYEGKEYFAQKETPESMMIAREERDRLLEKMKLLTQAQRRRLFMRMQGMSIRQIAETEGVRVQRVNQTTKEIFKKIF